MKEFHASLDGEQIPEFPSYAAAQTYHGPPWRSPPVTYLARIAEQYPKINPVWLFTGHGPPRVAEAHLLGALGLTTGGPELEQVSALFEEVLLGAVDDDYSAPVPPQWEQWATMRGSPTYPQVVASDDEVATANRIVAAVRAPLEHLGLRRSQLRSKTHCDAYVRLMCEALMQAWLAATTETKPLGEFQASLQREADAAREKGADEMLDKVRRRLVEATQGKDAADTSTQRKEKADDGE